ncbi:MAG: hypothetical protein IKW37_01300 [Bacteroidaceae bacterium]|nr:hypothetical protein [Bacteroidaceae bacterium]
MIRYLFSKGSKKVYINSASKPVSEGFTVEELDSMNLELGVAFEYERTRDVLIITKEE